MAAQAREAWSTYTEEPWAVELKSWRGMALPREETEYACMLRQRSAQILAGLFAHSPQDEESEDTGAKKRWSIEKVRSVGCAEEADYWDITIFQSEIVCAVKRQQGMEQEKAGHRWELHIKYNFPGQSWAIDPTYHRASFLITLLTHAGHLPVNESTLYMLQWYDETEFNIDDTISTKQGEYTSRRHRNNDC